MNKFLNFDLNYTYTSTYDGAEQDDPNKSSGQTNAQLVRVLNLLNLNTNFKISGLKNFNFLLSTKWSDVAEITEMEIELLMMKEPTIILLMI